ncbi:hypothetical protein F7725_011749 [Dissostichus mawsoni]|uniref:Uncharacterized protein n=1 Tax=Dissostichus mawsoni TaxID=36200 RepID=A0A7J5ZDX8_DISMA|nr:hypothetical protein F7725_011749 [Dissostichus mawsoni]
MLRQQKEAQQRIAVELKPRLNVIAKLQPAVREPEPIVEQDSEEESIDLMPPPPVQKVSEVKKAADQIEKERSAMLESLEEPSIIITPSSISTTPTPSLEEEEDDDFDDASEEFSFYKFSILNFQSNHGHTHLNQRLKQPLLPHDDEADVLACLTVWWIILRYMEDIPEPKSADAFSQASSTISSRVLPHKQGRRLSSLVGLDQPEDFTEDEDILIGEGPTLDRPLTSMEKLNIIIGYALSRRDIRGPNDYKEYCAKRLQRIIANGERKSCPVAKSKEPIEVSVTLMDDSTVSLQLDSLSTSAECEQEMRRQGKPEKDALWMLSIRKELFTPWHDCSKDPVSSDLIYRQVIKGIKIGDYMSDKMAAQHYYIKFGSAYSRENVQKVVGECIETTLIESKSMSKWIQLISAVILQVMCTQSHKWSYRSLSKGKLKTDIVKGDLVKNAQRAWPLHFSKFFEVIMMSGPPLPKSRFVVAVNWSGIFFMDGRDKRLLELPYLEVKEVRIIRYGQLFGSAYIIWFYPFKYSSVSLATIRGEFVLKSGECAEMAALIEKHLVGLKQRSVYALVRQDVNKPDDPMFLVCKRGDLLLAEEDEKDSPERNWFKATNQRTDASGAVYRDRVMFLPTLDKPTDELLELLTPGQNRTAATNAPEREVSVAPVSLKEFAIDNFRPAVRLGASKGAVREKLWACSREPLKQPLMKHLYMGDYPIKHARSPMELTDQIFGPATQYQALQDEIYCQIMRQMTNNNNRLSMERGWQLMWLCSGLFTPSRNLLGYTQRFLESRCREQLAPDCLQRLNGMRSKEPRNLPPHHVEVEAIQQNSTQIFHKIHFPNETSDIFEVQSTTTIEDLCRSIAYQLKLTSADGYGLSLKTTNKMVNLQDQKYLFDSLRQTAEPSKKGKRVKEGNTSYRHLQFYSQSFSLFIIGVLCSSNQASMPYLVIFKRKLWFNVSPGKDLELPRYLRGYHNCTKEEMTNIGGLLFRAEVDSDRSQFVMIPRMLRELVPADQINLMSPEEWKKHIIQAYSKQSGITVQEAKIEFLKAICSWPTFGCAFFEVKQTCESSYPNIVLFAISKLGISLIDPQTKEVLVMHPFSRIKDYQSEGNYFEMSIGTLLRAFVFVCETTQANTMEDLLRSYITMYERQRTALRPKHNIFS